MAARHLQELTQAITAGTATGYITVGDVTNFFKGTRVYLITGGVSTEGVVTSVDTTNNQLGILVSGGSGPNYGRSSMVPWAAGTLTRPEQWATGLTRQKTAGTTAPSTLLTNLMGFWKLNGNANDELGVSNGAEAPGVTYASGKIGQAAVFNGVSSWIDMTNNAHPTKELTVSIWVKWTGFSNNSRPAGDWHQNQNLDRWLFRDNGGSGSIQGHVLTSPLDNINPITTTVTFGTLSTGLWYHLVLLYDGRYVKAYVNNTLVDTADSGATPSFGLLNTNTSGHIAFGGQAELMPGNAINGMLDAVGLWNRALTPTEIADLYNSGNGKEYPF